MRKSRFSEEQIIGALKEHQAGLAVAEICRRNAIGEAERDGSSLRADE